MKCFVISPIGQANTTVRAHADEVFEHIIDPALRDFGIEAVRSDRMSETGRISDQMYRAIFEYDLCIAVLTYANPNVYYELAIAQSASRPVVIMIEAGSILPFDVADMRTLSYDLSITAYKSGTHVTQLKKFLEQLKQKHWKGEDLFRAYRPPRAKPDTLDVQACGVKITSPTRGQVVDVVAVEGVFAELPAGYELRSLRFYPDEMGFVPTGEIVVDARSKTWRVPRFDVGGASGDNRGIEIALAGANARILLDCWADAHQVHKVAMRELGDLANFDSKAKWLPAIRQWPTDLVTCDRVELKRK